MTTLVQSIRRLSPRAGGILPQWRPGLSGKRGLAVALAVALVSVVPGAWDSVLDALSEAYLAVSVFVAGTLALVFAAERAFKTDLGEWLMRHQRWQVSAATLLGAFPGCGGAIVAVTQFTRGYLSFGALVATLTATMGDAMFLLLAREPQSALVVLAISMVAGAGVGYLIDAIHGRGFMQPRTRQTVVDGSLQCSLAGKPEKTALDTAERFWLILMLPGLVIGILAAFQVDVDGLFPAGLSIEPAYWIGVAGAVLALGMWAVQGDGEGQGAGGCDSGTCGTGQDSLARMVIVNTNFVTTWVIVAFVAYEVLMALTGINLGQSLSVWAPLVPAMAILVGLIPGCGPQIMVTSLYVSGTVPFSAQLGNAMANDGDALFPALALAPRAALMATLYSAIPAIAVAYGWYTLIEMA